MLQVSVLGRQVITDDGTSVRIRSSRAVALVGFLVAHSGSPQARQRIAGLFWPDSTDGQALTNLRRELHQLRQVFGNEPSLVVTSRDLCWRDTETCRVDMRVFDVERKAALAAAANDDGEGFWSTPPGLSPSTGETFSLAFTMTGCSTPDQSLSGIAWTCVTWFQIGRATGR